MERGQDKLRSLARAGGFDKGHIPWEAIMNDIMGDRHRVEDEARLPNTGMPAEIERAFSSIFVEPFAMPVLISNPSPEDLCPYCSAASEDLGNHVCMLGMC